MKKKTKIIISAILILAIALGVYIPIGKSQGKFSKGNDEKYSVASTPALGDSPIRGKTVIFLGSSVTYGSAAKGESFVDYLEKRDGIKPVKSAVSGTFLVDEGKNPYISRLKKIDKNLKPYAFVCQLSTNDATKKKPLGKVSKSFNPEDFDTKTVAGAIEYVVSYVKDSWNCPLIFYTGTRYGSERYEEMVKLLYQVQKKWDFTILDLFNDSEMNNISKEKYKLYMANEIHPTRAGYREWWTPKFEDALYKLGNR